MQRRTIGALAAGKIAVSAALLVYVARQIEGNALKGAGERLDTTHAAAVIFIFWVIFVLGAVRWKNLAMLSGVTSSLLDSLSLNVIGHFFNQLLPTSFGGDAVRAWYARRNALGLVRAGALVVSDRIIGLAVMASLIAVLLPLTGSSTASERTRIQIWAIVALCVVGTAAFAAASPLFARHRRLSLLEWSGRLVLQVLRAPKRGAWIVGATILIHLLNGIAGYILVQALWPSAITSHCIVLFLVALLVSAVPISYAGWGVREASTVYFLREAGIPADVAFGTSVMYGALLAIATLPGAMFWATRAWRSHQ
jgi:uncharacterized membrane protein YbhN (UPF0104 family)